MTPFLTLYTPTYLRPARLARCMDSVRRQTVARAIEHIVLPDYVGLGIVEGLYGRLVTYAPMAHGEYVHVLADDDVLENETVVERVMDFASAHGNPEVIVVDVRKDEWVLPCGSIAPPACGRIDMGCLIQRRDIFQRFVSAYCTGRYEGDGDHAVAMWEAGVRFTRYPLMFVHGEALKGVAEA